MARYLLSDGVKARWVTGNRGALPLLITAQWHGVPPGLIARAKKRLSELMNDDDETLGRCLHDLIDSVDVCIRLQVVRAPNLAPAPRRGPVF
jgi:hypothetical protein